jgi:hypothetical protein
MVRDTAYIHTTMSIVSRRGSLRIDLVQQTLAEFIESASGKPDSLGSTIEILDIAHFEDCILSSSVH